MVMAVSSVYRGDRSATSTSARADGDAAVPQLGQAVELLMAAIEDPQRLVIQVAEGEQLVGVDPVGGAALDQRHLGVVVLVEQALEVLDGAGRGLLAQRDAVPARASS